MLDTIIANSYSSGKRSKDRNRYSISASKALGMAFKLDIYVLIVSFLAEQIPNDLFLRVTANSVLKWAVTKKEITLEI
jgi:hypothetical protein